ncbi:MAG: chromosome partitioning protein ParB [Tenericutes bacterium]|nr:MAG: chromosome partitioning protein ParB [Mycoplasmatota bacterium]
MATNKTTKKTTTKKTTTKKPTLNRGLDAIFGDGLSDLINDIQKPASKTKSAKTTQPKKKSDLSPEDVMVNTSISKIIASPFNPRKQFDKEKLEDLANSIKENGLLTPIILRPTVGGKFYIVAGERRYRASKMANQKTIKSIIVNVTDKKMAELALIENIQREDLNPIEEAVAIQNLITLHKITQLQASKTLGKSRTYITNTLRLLKLPSKILDYVLEGKMSFGHAKPLISLPTEYSLELADRIISEKLTVREVENYAKAFKLREIRASKPKKQIKKDVHLEYVEELIRKKIGSKVVVQDKKIIIKYRDNQHLNRILSKLEIGEE